MHCQRQLNTIQHLRKFISLNPVINNSADINLAQMCTTKYIPELRPLPLRFEFWSWNSNSNLGYKIFISPRKQIKTCYYLPLTAFNLFPTICFATKDAIVEDYLKKNYISLNKRMHYNCKQFILIWYWKIYLCRYLQVNERSIIWK